MKDSTRSARRFAVGMTLFALFSVTNATQASSQGTRMLRSPTVSSAGRTISVQVNSSPTFSGASEVMVINERAGSGGDLMPYLFRFRGIGPLVGAKTWGGLVGTWDTPPLIDGGSFLAPRGGFFDVNGEWAVEAEALRLLATERVELRSEPPPPIRYRRPGGGGR